MGGGRARSQLLAARRSLELVRELDAGDRPGPDAGRARLSGRQPGRPAAAGSRGGSPAPPRSRPGTPRPACAARPGRCIAGGGPHQRRAGNLRPDSTAGRVEAGQHRAGVASVARIGRRYPRTVGAPGAGGPGELPLHLAGGARPGSGRAGQQAAPYSTARSSGQQRLVVSGWNARPHSQRRRHSQSLGLGHGKDSPDAGESRSAGAFRRMVAVRGANPHWRRQWDGAGVERHDGGGTVDAFRAHHGDHRDGALVA